MVEAARVALCLPAHERATLHRVLAADVSRVGEVEAEIASPVAALAEVVPDTPAAILPSLPGVAVVRASNYFFRESS